MRSQHHQHTGAVNHHADPAGRVDGPGLLYGAVGLALAVAMQVIGLFKKGDVRLKNSMLDSVFHGVVPDQLSIAVLVVITAVFCFGIAFAVLDSAGTWRRVILGVTALLVIIAMVPTFAVWKIYFSPFLPAIGIFWTWFCTMMYVNHHVMPCDVISSEFQTPNTKLEAAAPLVEKKVEPKMPVAKEPSNKKTATKKSTAKRKSIKQTKKKKSQDPNAKYKPKDLKED